MGMTLTVVTKEAIETLARQHAETPPLLRYLPDIQIYHKAVDWALKHRIFFKPSELKTAEDLLVAGNKRAAQLAKGKTPWSRATGLVVRGYVSRLDDSVQPYGLVIPESFSTDPWRKRRLDIWLHGRDNKGGKGDGVLTLAYHMPSDPKGNWSTTLLDGNMHMSHNFDVAEWDGDQANEMLLSGLEGVFLLNPSKDGTWNRRQISNNPTGEVRQGAGAGGKNFVTAIEPMHGNQLSIYTPAKGTKLWNRNVIDESLDQGHALATGDFMGSGSDQIVVGWRGTRRTGKVGVKLYYPTNEQRSEWKSMLVDDNEMATEDIRIADLNADGKIDIVAAGRASHNLKIYFNE